MSTTGFVYIMTNKNKTTLYIGVTNNLCGRIHEHKNHLIKDTFTDKYNIEYCIYYEEFIYFDLAIQREKEIKKYARRSIVASQNIKKGDKITDKSIEYKRPGTGIPPKLSSLVIGKIAKSDIGKDELITFKRLR